jgi:hypothetical protein
VAQIAISFVVFNTLLLLTIGDPTRPLSFTRIGWLISLFELNAHKAATCCARLGLSTGLFLAAVGRQAQARSTATRIVLGISGDESGIDTGQTLIGSRPLEKKWQSLPKFP